MDVDDCLGTIYVKYGGGFKHFLEFSLLPAGKGSNLTILFFPQMGSLSQHLGKG